MLDAPPVQTRHACPSLHGALRLTAGVQTATGVGCSQALDDRTPRWPSSQYGDSSYGQGVEGFPVPGTAIRGRASPEEAQVAHSCKSRAGGSEKMLCNHTHGAPAEAASPSPGCPLQQDGAWPGPPRTTAQTDGRTAPHTRALRLCGTVHPSSPGWVPERHGPVSSCRTTGGQISLCLFLSVLRGRDKWPSRREPFRLLGTEKCGRSASDGKAV